MNIEKNIAAFTSLGERLRAIASGNSDAETESVISAASSTNPWFIKENILNALGAIGESLNRDHLNQWLAPYREKISSSGRKKVVAVINAGNIPAVGFHDFLCVLLSGNIYHGKNSSDDLHLLPFIASLLKKIEPRFEEEIFFVDRISNPDAVIATGSNNSARYFNYYFGKYPHIIRRNRNGVAVLDGNENTEELSALADDVFQYFGLGCRSVSKIFVPEDFDVRKLFPVFEKYNSVSHHNRYMNNYNYQRVLLLMNKAPFLENGFVILREATSLHSPISVLHYERYKNVGEVIDKLFAQSEEVQCVACGKELSPRSPLTRKGEIPSRKSVGGSPFRESEGERGQLPLVPLGQTQNPKLWDYADAVDTMEFLCFG